MAFNEKYVTVTGGGLHDGSSEANAWTLDEAYSNHAAGDRLNMKAGNYTATQNYNVWSSNSISSPFSIRGYKTVIGDLDTKPMSQLVDGTDRPLIEFNTSYYMHFNQTQYNVFENITFQSNTNRPALYADAYRTAFNRCKFIADSAGSLDFTPCIRRSNLASYSFFTNCMFDGNGAFRTQTLTEATMFIGCVFQDFNKIGCNEFQQFQSCVFRNMNYGIEIADWGWNGISGNTFYNITYDAILALTNAVPSSGSIAITNNVFHTIGGDAIKSHTSGNFDFFCDNNLFYNVTGNNYSNNLNLSRNELVDTSDPFTDAAGGDYSLVSGSNGYNAAQPSLFEGLSIGSKRDVGAIHHQDPSGGGNVIVIEE